MQNIALQSEIKEINDDLSSIITQDNAEIRTQFEAIKKLRGKGL